MYGIFWVWILLVVYLDLCLIINFRVTVLYIFYLIFIIPISMHADRKIPVFYYFIFTSYAFHIFIFFYCSSHSAMHFIAWVIGISCWWNWFFGITGMSLRTKGKPEKANGANNTESSLVSGEFSPVSMDIERPHSEDQRPDSPMYMQKERSEVRELNSDRKNGRAQTLQQTENRRVIIITHINIFLYATCFWIQNGTLPVSFLY